MSGLAETSPNSARPRCTHVRAIIDATALSVRLADNLCCAEFATHTGLVRVLLPADRFVAAARAERDANGNPFPVPRAGTRSEANLRILEEDAAQVPVVLKPRGVILNLTEGGKRCEAAWADLKGDPTLTLKAVAARHAISRSFLASWLARNHPAEYAQAKAACAAARTKNRGVRDTLEAAWQVLRENPHMLAQDAAYSVGVPPASLSAYLRMHHAEDWDALKAERRAARKEEKRRAANARAGGPILKPGGKLL